MQTQPSPVPVTDPPANGCHSAFGRSFRRRIDCGELTSTIAPPPITRSSRGRGVRETVRDPLRPLDDHPS